MGPDIFLFDMRPMLTNDDVVAFLPNVDCGILVAAEQSSRLAKARRRSCFQRRVLRLAVRPWLRQGICSLYRT